MRYVSAWENFYSGLDTEYRHIAKLTVRVRQDQSQA